MFPVSYNFDANNLIIKRPPHAGKHANYQLSFKKIPDSLSGVLLYVMPHGSDEWEPVIKDGVHILTALNKSRSFIIKGFVEAYKIEIIGGEVGQIKLTEMAGV